MKSSLPSGFVDDEVFEVDSLLHCNPCGRPCKLLVIPVRLCYGGDEEGSWDHSRNHEEEEGIREGIGRSRQPVGQVEGKRWEARWRRTCQKHWGAGEEP
jgi:hypothetical protein